MPHHLPIDTSLDFRSESGGRDPDRYSPTLREYHRRLWSKPLPGGHLFTLEDRYPKGYLRHESDLGVFRLSSDTIIRTFKNHVGMRPVIRAIPPEEQEEFSRLGYTIGGMIVFPSNRIDGKHTINQARGMSGRIGDRFDLTLESIRRYYDGGDSPIGEALARYSDFFALFESFVGYVDFFLLQDLVADDYRSVRFFAPFEDFAQSPLISTVGDYVSYRSKTIDFVRARNARIAASGS
ncbi:MAG: hypothetical protein U1E32_10585 [Rhodoglobus sp.]|nr:hypothetical protein [Rhodoglobus sp.]